MIIDWENAALSSCAVFLYTFLTEAILFVPRVLVRLTAIAILAIALPCSHVMAQYPDRPIRLVLTFPPGSALDGMARLMADALGAQLKGSMVVDNVPGAGGVIGVDRVVASPKDGYTLLLATMGNLTINPHIYKNVKHNTLTDLVPVGPVAITSNALGVRAGLPVKTVSELIQYARANPGKLTYGSSGIGSSSHLAGVMFASMAGIDMLHVPYKGAAQALQDLIAGRIDVMIDPASSFVNIVRDGRVVVLARTTRMKVPTLPPEWPSLDEAGVPGFDLGTWIAVMAPAGVSAGVLERLRQALNAVVTQPQFPEKVQPSQPLVLTIPEFERYIRSQHEHWGRIVKLSGAAASQ
jgi:tripartite-type tricarboxylate transporter receptor subunit TctC